LFCKDKHNFKKTTAKERKKSLFADFETVLLILKLKPPHS